MYFPHTKNKVVLNIRKCLNKNMRICIRSLRFAWLSGISTHVFAEFFRILRRRDSSHVLWRLDFFRTFTALGKYTNTPTLDLSAKSSWPVFPTCLSSCTTIIQRQDKASWWACYKRMPFYIQSFFTLECDYFYVPFVKICLIRKLWDLIRLELVFVCQGRREHDYVRRLVMSKWWLFRNGDLWC